MARVTVTADELARGDRMTVDRLKGTISHVGAAVRYAPRRDSVSLVRITFRPDNPRRSTRQVDYLKTDRVTVERAAAFEVIHDNAVAPRR